MSSTCASDVHKVAIVIVALDVIGRIESRSQVKTKAENLCDSFHGIGGKVEVIYEEGPRSV